MLNNDLKIIIHKRIPRYKDNCNSSVAIRIKDGDNKWVITLTKEFCAQPLRKVWLIVCTKNGI